MKHTEIRIEKMNPTDKVETQIRLEKIIAKTKLDTDKNRGNKS